VLRKKRGTLSPAGTASEGCDLGDRCLCTSVVGVVLTEEADGVSHEVTRLLDADRADVAAKQIRRVSPEFAGQFDRPVLHALGELRSR
jgi:hypothetical protein